VTNPTGQGCTGCHGTPATIPQVNAANAVSVLNSAITNNAGGAMGAFAGLSATDRASLALYIGSTTTQSQSTFVNFGGATAITLNNIATTSGTSQVITALSTVSGPARGTLSAYNNATPSVTYTHTATSCTADSFTFRGTGLSGAATSNRTVSVTVNPPTAPTSANSTSNIAYSTAPLAIPLTLGGGTTNSISASALSPAVGTLSVVGTSVTYTASSTQYAPGPCASSASSTVTINVAPPPTPVITSSNTASGTGGQPFNYATVATNVPTSYSSTALPAGLTLNTTTGVISGTPTVTGSFPVTLSAMNGSGTGTLPLTINIALVTPAISSVLTANATSGSPFTYTITANNLPASFNATGLPTGLSVNTSTGVISGTPVVLVGGPVNVSISATNLTGTDTKTLVLTVSLNPPTFTSATTAAGTSGQAFSFQITATDFPSSYGATGLPAGLTLNTTSGLISGTAVVTATTTFSVMLTATNGSGTTSQTLAITITLPAPVITSAATAAGAATQAFNYQIAASGAPTSFGATGLPAGLSVNTTTGAISGVPVAAGVSTVTVTATNASGTGSRAVTVTIGNQPPPTVAGLSSNVAFNTPITIDLLPFVSGGATSIAIASPPAHGTVLVSGFSVTYTPATDYFGADSFLFTSSGPGGTSAPANVSLLVATPAAPTAAARTAAVPFNTATPIDLSAAVSGIATTVAVSVAPAHGTTTVSGKIVTYTPATDYFGDDVFTYPATGPGGTSAGADVTIKVTALAPTARAVNFILPLNTPTTLDLAPFIKGSAITGVAIVGILPQHGTVTVAGTKVIFTPKKDYFGSDSFSYTAFGIAGSSPAAAVKVTIVGRPDPTKDAAVTGLVAAQTDAAKRFARAQISNFQSRMESLHQGEGGAAMSSRGAEAGSTAVAAKSPLPDAPSTRAELGGSAKENAFLHSSLASAQGSADGSGALPRPVPFLSDAMSLLTSGSVNVASLAGTTGVATPAGPSAPSLWLAGSANFGSRTATGERSGLDFTTSGISMGIDRRFGERLVAGVGVGFARDNTDIGTDGSRSRARAYTGVAYASYQPAPQIFIDGLAGIGSLDFKSRRYVTPIEEIASGNRKGRQLFGSIAAGYEYRNNGVLISPYARFDYASDRLNQFSETGAGQYALTYFQQTTPSIQGALGVRAESVHLTSFGYAAPRMRAEYRHDFQGERQTSIGYADGVGGRFGLSTGAVTRNSLLVGVGSEFV
ncbi:MAG: autotransporter domain-containing protein, partial [Usitatibacteraceae bacterium]